MISGIISILDNLRGKDQDISQIKGLEELQQSIRDLSCREGWGFLCSRAVMPVSVTRTTS